jgi:acyl-CoA hydrolase
MTLEEATAKAESRQVHLIVPGSVNHYETLHGGMALNWMDEVAFITATRFSRQKFVTVSMDKTDFKRPVPGGCIAEIVGKIESVGKSSLKVKVSIFIERMDVPGQELAVEGYITMVAIDEEKRSTPIKLPY